MSSAAAGWRNVWLVLDDRHTWRKRLEHREGNEYWGTGVHQTKEEAEARGNRDARHFVDEMGMSVSYVGAREYAALTVKE